MKRFAGSLLDDYRALDSLLLLKAKNGDEFARVLAEPNGRTAADLALGIVRPPKLPTITLCGQEMSRKDAAIRLWQLEHNGEMPDEDDRSLTASGAGWSPIKPPLTSSSRPARRALAQADLEPADLDLITLDIRERKAASVHP